LIDFTPVLDDDGAAQRAAYRYAGSALLTPYCLASELPDNFVVSTDHSATSLYCRIVHYCSSCVYLEKLYFIHSVSVAFCLKYSL
jgi:hypothetical protein